MTYQFHRRVLNGEFPTREDALEELSRMCRYRVHNLPDDIEEYFYDREVRQRFLSMSEEYAAAQVRPKLLKRLKDSYAADVPMNTLLLLLFLAMSAYAAYGFVR